MLPEPRLFIVGATDTGAALTLVAKLLGFRVVVIDAREAYASPERFPDADDLVCAWPVEALTAAHLDAQSYVVTLTHDPKLDVPALATALRSPVPYVGALGSRRTHERRKQSLRDLGFSDADLERIHAPVGLDLGGRSPQEIAVAVAAEMVANRYGRDSRAVREDVKKVRPEVSTMPVSGVILAAGSSVRMGQPKQLLRVGGARSSISSSTPRSDRGLSEVSVVLGAYDEQVRRSIRAAESERLRIVVNEAHARGVSTSLRCGLAACSPSSEGAAIFSPISRASTRRSSIPCWPRSRPDALRSSALCSRVPTVRPSRAILCCWRARYGRCSKPSTAMKGRVP